MVKRGGDLHKAYWNDDSAQQQSVYSFSNCSGLSEWRMAATIASRLRRLYFVQNSLHVSRLWNCHSSTPFCHWHSLYGRFVLIVTGLLDAHRSAPGAVLLISLLFPFLCLAKPSTIS